MRNFLWVFFFAALGMSAPAAGHEPADVVIRVENPATATPTAPCTDKPCIPVVVEPIKLVPAGTGVAPTLTPNPTPAPAAKPADSSGAPWWVWPLCLLALAGLGFAAWRNNQAQAERERRARDAAECAAQEARERREDQAVEERERARESLLKAAAIAAWEREHGLMNDAERRAFETRWALASHDRQIQSAPARLDVVVDSVSAIVRPAEILGGRRVERRVIQQDTPPAPLPAPVQTPPSVNVPAPTPAPAPTPTSTPAPNPPAPQTRNEPRTNEPERRPIGEGKLAGLRGREQACGRTGVVADQHLCGLLHVRSLEEPVTRDDLNNAFVALDQEMASHGLPDYREWRRQQDAAAARQQAGGGAAPAAPTTTATAATTTAEGEGTKKSEPAEPEGEKPADKTADESEKKGEGVEEPKPA